MPKKRTKPINSKRKGKEWELRAAKFLTSLGYPTIRGQQFKGGEDSPDICKPPDFEGVSIHDVIHFEVKSDRSVRLGTKALEDACKQALREKGDLSDAYVLWWEHGTGWRLTRAGCLCPTWAGDEAIARRLLDISDVYGVTRNDP